jgi:hypothetical protein
MDILVKPPLGLKPDRGTATRLRELLAGLEP